MNDEVVNNEENKDENSLSSELNQQNQDHEPQVSAGTQLRVLREERGWSIEQVASQLNLAPRQIDALEQNNFAALPGLVIVRGFIRTYAKLLRVDAAPILAAVETPAVAANVVPERAPLSASFSETSVPFGKRRGPSGLVIVAALVVLCGALFFVARNAGWISSSELAAVVNDGSVVKELPVDAASSTFVEPTPQEQTFADAPTLESASESSTVDAAPAVAPAPVTAPLVAPVAKPVATETVATPVATSAPVASTGKNKIVFQVKEDSWVEIKLADDSILVSRVFHAGTTESFDIPSPASVVIGNAAGVSVTLRGQPLSIAGSSNNVARLNVK